MQNGRLTRRQLAAIHHPKLGLSLAAGDAVASWNTMRLFLLQRYGSRGDIYPEGPLGAYRDYAGQVRCREEYGNNAAVPGTSNHGLGHAVDVADHFMAGLIDKHGFSIANLSCRLIEGGRQFEYRMTIKSRNRKNAEALAAHLRTLPEVVEFRISPTGD